MSFPAVAGGALAIAPRSQVHVALPQVPQAQRAVKCAGERRGGEWLHMAEMWYAAPRERDR